MHHDHGELGTVEPFRVHVTAESQESLQAWLDEAEARAIEHARAHGRHGVLVTRTGPGTFYVELSEEVPYGTTAERDMI